MAVVSAILLAGYFAFVLYGLLSPSTDPQRAMAQGFLSFVAFILILLGVILWFGVAHDHPLLVRFVFGICILPALSPIARLIYLIVHR